MKKIKVHTVIGTRPEAIKMAILCKLLQSSTFFEHTLISTGQHREMLQQILSFFELKPDVDLNIMTENQNLTSITCETLKGLKNYFSHQKPDMVLVQGDTTTSFAAALSSFYHRIPVGHVEAGLRTFNKYSPFPEEINRSLTGRIADIHFCPTETNRRNLLHEGIAPEKIYVTGNTVIDALHYTKNRVHFFSDKVTDERLKKVFSKPNRKILITGHRRENFGERFLQICRAIKVLSEKFSEIYFVYPVHLNPNVQKPVHEILGGLPNVVLTRPLDYPDFVFAMKNSYFLLTDSGGVQEEAPSLGKPVLVMRDTTERPEAIEAGTVKLVGACMNSIINETSKLLEDKELFDSMSMAHNPYGDGKASERIVEILFKHLN